MWELAFQPCWTPTRSRDAFAHPSMPTQVYEVLFVWPLLAAEGAVQVAEAEVKVPPETA